ncbi:MAG TPA: BadF/BadG/BcrA/BcrD ATPase family protein [Chloroflexota bacterium]|nr:BadF/BadG/BcrA/BcrD ATPase family protein [Chloroflexota bacterium]
MDPNALVAGVDGGNTKTLAVVADLHGHVLGVGRAGCGDIYGSAGEESALAELCRAVGQALADAPEDRRSVTAAVFTIAGADWPEDHAFIRLELARRLGIERLDVHNDAFGALRAGSAENSGVAVVVGTGAAIAARHPTGFSWHSGWWQEPQGSLHLARQALGAVYRAELGIGPPTCLTARAVNLFGAGSVEGLLHSLTARGHPPIDISPFTRPLLDSARQGDAVAAQIVAHHGSQLGEYARAAARRAGLASPYTVLVLGGGVLANDHGMLAQEIARVFRSEYPSAVVRRLRCEPAVGAVLLAIELCGFTAKRSVAGRLRHTLAEAESHQVTRSRLQGMIREPLPSRESPEMS